MRSGEDRSARCPNIGKDEAMCSRSALRSNPRFWSAAAPLVLTAGAALLQLFVLDAAAGMHEATEFSVPAGSPDEYMQAGAAFARELEYLTRCRMLLAGDKLANGSDPISVIALSLGCSNYPRSSMSIETRRMRTRNDPETSASSCGR